MIKLRDGELANILPESFTRQPQVRALSYALKRAYQRLCTYQDGIYVFACIDRAREDVLDLLAVELRVRYYQDDFPIDKKRALIKSAIFVSLKDGTKYAVDSVLDTSLEGGMAVEWYEYGGDPGCFKLDVDIDNNNIDVDKVIGAIDTVKRKSAHLDSVNLQLDAEQGLFFGSILQASAVVTMWTEDPFTTHMTLDQGLLDRNTLA